MKSITTSTLGSGDRIALLIVSGSVAINSCSCGNEEETVDRFLRRDLTADSVSRHSG